MKLKQITLTNFRCFEQFTFELHPNLTVIIGENGAGKTAILDAIKVGLGEFLKRLPETNANGTGFKITDLRVFGEEQMIPYPHVQKTPYVHVAFESTKQIKWDRIKLRDQTSDTKKHRPNRIGLKHLNSYIDQMYIDKHNRRESYELPIFAYYGTGRGVFDIPKRARDFTQDFSSRFDAYDNALTERTDFRQLLKQFYFLERIENETKVEKRDFDYEYPPLDVVRRAIEKALPYASNPRSRQKPLRFLIDWRVNDEVSTLRIEQLSDGYRTTLAMIMDIAGRMAMANPDMPDPLLTEGIVLIDEVELHLHPQLQREFLDILRRVFPNIQYVLTTHSAPIVSHAKDGFVYLVSNKQAIKSDTYGHDSNYLLQRIFGTSDKPIEIQQQLDYAANLIDQDQLNEAKRVLESLEQTIANGADDPQLIYLKGLIKFMDDWELVEE